jgi:type IV pilus assembly protein PilY1
VVDVSNGHILWSFTHDGSGNAGNVKMDYNLAAGPVGIDTDNDGFIDTAYVGDLGGNVWRFKFCLQSQGTSCNVSNWTGNLLLNNH